ncbi:hypothetical protein BDB01DRAFT_334020 [Pilobolus umbonatus]|nr:hypothetical protein BDB01DRAFT_334020 [Pilobolus umbonatus]
MSTRHARTADKASNEKNTRILKTLLQKESNKYCADCKKKDARWASWNLGIFICIRCSGVHRSLGTHISKVKSVDLDTWLTEQVENMVRWGNERANKYWEAELRNRKPNESNMEAWIRSKYEQKRWAMKGPMPDPSTLGEEEQNETEVVAQQPRRPATTPAMHQKTVEKPKVNQSEFANLDAFLGTPTSSTAASTQSSPGTASQLKGADFFFGSFSGQSTHSTPSDTQPPPAPKKQDDFSSILSLYNNIPAASLRTNRATYGNHQQQMSDQNMNLSGMNSNMTWGYTNNAVQPTQPTQPNLPQGSQFFSTPEITPKKPERDVFADLLG